LKLFLVILIISVFLGCNKTTDNKSINATKKDKKSTNCVTETELVIKESLLPHRTVYTKSIKDIFDVFDSIGYGSKKWYDQSQIIPRIYLQRISCRWKNQSDKMPVELKKDIFFKLITPSILRANELILMDRKHLLSLNQNSFDLNATEHSWLISQLKKYKIINKKDTDIEIKKEYLDKLKKRMDTIAPSLALAQAAEESGWATSRFASEGNALFGQWTTSKNAMIPNRQREQFSNFGLARFKTPQDSVNSYMLNLNTHKAYKKLRDKRAILRKDSKPITGIALSETLDKYSERGYEYVKNLKMMIKHNHLAHFDTAKLWNKEVILLVPIKNRKKRDLQNDCNNSKKRDSTYKSP